MKEILGFFVFMILFLILGLLSIPMIFLPIIIINIIKSLGISFENFNEFLIDLADGAYDMTKAITRKKI